MNKYEEYQICKKRGHQPALYSYLLHVEGFVCKFCGVHYWTETVKHEENIPDEPTKGEGE